MGLEWNKELCAPTAAVINMRRSIYTVFINILSVLVDSIVTTTPTYNNIICYYINNIIYKVSTGTYSLQEKTSQTTMRLNLTYSTIKIWPLTFKVANTIKYFINL